MLKIILGNTQEKFFVSHSNYHNPSFHFILVFISTRDSFFLSLILFGLTKDILGE